ncbi:type IV conjugative transfer system protein TraL [Desulfurobacterium sp. TC5-1]|uniref:type IV conjugative transfer system protein TraL n=1 Tax=Desulfurobacterium sp. TC5-1 TaxID=1158318 RepID=UPI0003B45C93|nr:type IV conjugative transfer system protein TraL [Desulfurobacterium sp. TC5-1]
MRRYVPKYLNAQPQFLWWELDDLIFFMAPIMIGLWTDRLLIGLGVGLILEQAYGKLKTQSQPGFLWHFLYWHGLYNSKNKRFPESWKRELVE